MIATPTTDNESAERAFLASVVLAYTVYPERVPAVVTLAVSRIRPADFGVFRLGEIYTQALEMIRSDKRPETVALARHIAKATGGDAVAGVMDEIFSLGDLATCSNINHYAGLICEASAERQAQQIGQQLSREIAEGRDFRKAASTSARQLAELSTAGQAEQDWASAEDMAGLVMDAHEQAKKNTREWTGLDTGFPAINELLDGLAPAEMTVIGARPGVGKTTLALQFALAAMQREGVAVGMLSLEMSQKQIGERLLSILTGLGVHAIRKGRLNPQEQSYLAEASKVLARIKFYCNDQPGLNVAQVGSLMRRLADHAQIGLWIVDYVQLMTGPEDSENERMEVISKALNGLCKTPNAPLVVLSQFSRAVENRTDRRPQLSDFRGSGGIEQVTDNALLLYRPAYHGLKSGNGEPDNLAVVIAAKTRFGPTGDAALLWVSPGKLINPAPTYRHEPVPHYQDER